MLLACDPQEMAKAQAEACVQSCNAESTSQTDRETCALVCNATPVDANLGRTATARLDACTSACSRPRSTDGATCRLNCIEVVTRTLDDAPHRACHHGCLEQLDACGATCAKERGSDHATCELVCDEQAQHCVDACGVSAPQ
jgi:hypothetical protein